MTDFQAERQLRERSPFESASSVLLCLVGLLFLSVAFGVSAQAEPDKRAQQEMIDRILKAPAGNEQAETTDEQWESQWESVGKLQPQSEEQLDAELRQSCNTLPKEDRIKRKEYGTLMEGEREERLDALKKEISRIHSELVPLSEELTAVLKRSFEILSDQDEADRNKAKYDSLVAKWNSIGEKSNRLGDEWCSLFGR